MEAGTFDRSDRTTLTVRQMTDTDVARVLAMAVRFLMTTAYGKHLPGEYHFLVRTLDVVRKHGIVLVAEMELDEGAGPVVVGFIALTALPHPFNGEKFADEIAWWVEPEVRGREVGRQLLLQAEAWACTEKLTMLRMIEPEGSPIGELYARLGYAPVERAWHKRL